MPHTVSRPVHRLFACLILVLCCLCVERAWAQTGDGAARVRELHRLALEAFARTDYPMAETHLRELLDLDGENFVVHYNLACARAVQDDVDAAFTRLASAIALGFADRTQLEADPHLSSIRSDPRYAVLLDKWDEIIRLQATSRSSRLAERFKGYDESRDEQLKLVYLSSFDAVTTEGVRRELARLARWAAASLFTDLAEDDDADAWVAVVLPTQEDFERWRFAHYGTAGKSDMRQIGGSYRHDEKLLITLDLGGSLRHEFFHALHWRSMTRLGQIHPIWIQEGLGALVEDTDPAGDGSLTPVPSWRTNIVRNLARNGRLMKIEDLVEMSPDVFANRNPLANYAQARAFFLFVDAHDKLGQWYEVYTREYDADRGGLDTALTVLGYADLDELNREYRAWARSLPQVPEQLRPPKVRLGFETERTSGDGMIVTGFNSRHARRAGLRLGDVVTTLDGMPVRDINELLRRLGGRSAGETVTLGVRRRNMHSEVRVVLQPRQ